MTVKMIRPIDGTLTVEFRRPWYRRWIDRAYWWVHNWLLIDPHEAMLLEAENNRRSPVNQVAQLPAMDAEDIAAVNRAKKDLMKVIRPIPQAIATIAMIEIVHTIATHENCPGEYRQLVAPLLRKLAEDIDQVEADAPKILVSG